MEKKLIALRKAWLKKARIDIPDFADATRLDYNTVCRWFIYGRTPRELYLERVLSVYPSWPHPGNL